MAIPQSIYTPDHQLFRDTVKKFIEREIAPYHAQWEKDGVVDRNLWRRAGEAGLLCTSIPAQYGGGDGDFLHSATARPWPCARHPSHPRPRVRRPCRRG